MKELTLNNGVKIPQLGFGTWKLEDGKEAYEAVEAALKAGYRHIDTAQVYRNEASVGRAIKDSGIDRDDLFVTTKSWNTHQTYDDVMTAFEESLEKLQMGYVDLFLLHWPTPVDTRKGDAWKEINAERWRALEELYRSNKVRAIGISNFMEKHIEVLDATATVKPMVNQVLLAPGETQTDLVDYCRERDIVMEAYSPFGSGDLFSHPEIEKLTEKYNKSASQIMLRWSLQHDFIPLPRSSNPAHIQDNLNVFDFELLAEDMKHLDELVSETKQRDPESVDF